MGVSWPNKAISCTCCQRGLPAPVPRPSGPAWSELGGPGQMVRGGPQSPCPLTPSHPGQSWVLPVGWGGPRFRPEKVFPELGRACCVPEEPRKKPLLGACGGGVGSRTEEGGRAGCQLLRPRLRGLCWGQTVWPGLPTGWALACPAGWPSSTVDLSPLRAGAELPAHRGHRRWCAGVCPAGWGLFGVRGQAWPVPRSCGRL